MTYRFSLLIVGLLVAGSAHAADKPVQKPAAPQPAAASSPPQLDPETAKALETVVATTGAAEIMSSNLKRLSPYLIDPLIKANPGKDELLRAAVDKALTQSIDDSREIFLAGVRTAYVRIMTPDELKAAAAFAATPVGKKFIGAQAIINRDISITGQQITKRVAESTVKALKAEGEKSGFTIPKELSE